MPKHKTSKSRVKIRSTNGARKSIKEWSFFMNHLRHHAGHTLSFTLTNIQLFSTPKGNHTQVLPYPQRSKKEMFVRVFVSKQTHVIHEALALTSWPSTVLTSRALQRDWLFSHAQRAYKMTTVHQTKHTP